MSTLNDSNLNSIAHRMLDDYDNATPGTVFSEGLLLDEADAWRLQQAVALLREKRGEKAIGYKIGCVSPGNQQMMGLSHPVWGRLWDSEIHEDGATLRKADYSNIALEAEFGVTFCNDINTSTSTDKITASVDAIYPVIEMHNLTLRGKPPYGHELIANNAIHCGVIKGAPIREPASTIQTDMQLAYDGETVDSWDKLVWPVDILAAVHWLAQRLGADGTVLKKGELILTGAWGPPIALADHTHVALTSSAFGNVNASFS